MTGEESYLLQKYRKTNNKYRKFYKKYKPSKCIIYEDANNLYGWEMSQYLLFVRIKWLTQGKIDRIDLNTI